MDKRRSKTTSLSVIQRFTDGEEYEVRGTLVEISTRFWNAWGYGTIRTDFGDISITGALEGHIVGTGLIVRGKFKSETKYGAQITAYAIAVDELTPTLAVINAWAVRSCPDSAEAIAEALYEVPLDERWEKLGSKEFLAEQGIPDAANVAALVSAYLRMLEERRELLELGFTNREADKIFNLAKGSDLSALIREDIYQLVLIGFSFTRIDTIAKKKGLCARDTDNRRLLAATVAALRFAESNGHTALREKDLIHEMAKVAGVYKGDSDVFYRQQRPVETSRLLRKYGDFVQRTQTAKREEAIARWVVCQAMKSAEET